jgi:nickel-dependent lactate racemase
MCAIGGETTAIDDDQLRSEIGKFLHKLGPKDDVFLLPPDYTRFHSQAGKITAMIAEYYKFIPSSSSSGPTTSATEPPKLEIMPALGTHAPMTPEQIRNMYGEELAKKEPSPFLVHDWRNDVETIGYVSSEMVKEATRGMVDEPWPAQLNKKVWEKRKSNPNNTDKGEKSVVISIGQGECNF